MASEKPQNDNTKNFLIITFVILILCSISSGVAYYNPGGFI